MTLPTSAVGAGGTAREGSPGARPPLRDLLQAAITHGASDLHVRAGAPPLIRVSGDLWALEAPDLTPEDTEALVDLALPTDADRATFASERECDFALTAPGLGRFRVNAYRTRGTAAMVLRLVKEIIPTFEELGLPRAARDLALRPMGLVLVCGDDRRHQW
jgi:twitching motility protein PilT